MITSEQIVQVFYDRLVSSDLASEVTGGVYKAARPAGSLLEDVCISVRANQNAQRQEAVVYVNTYVQDVRHDGYSERATARVKALEALIVSALESGWGDGYRFEIDTMEIQASEDTDEHIIVTRILFQFINE